MKNSILLSLSLIAIHTLTAAEEQLPATSSTRHCMPSCNRLHPAKIIKLGVKVICCTASAVALGTGAAYLVHSIKASPPKTKYINIYSDYCDSPGCPQGFERTRLCFPSNNSDYQALQTTLQEICPDNSLISTPSSWGTLPCKPLHETIKNLNKTCSRSLQEQMPRYPYKLASIKQPQKRK